MAKLEKQKEARELRLKGYTIPEIEKAIGCPRSSVHYWIKDLILPTEGIARLESKKNTNREKKIIDLDKLQLKQLVDEEYTTREIANKLGSSFGVVKKNLERYNFQVSNPQPKNTKNKGDRGVGFVIADLMGKDIHVALPISEHLPFDLIAIGDEKLSRLSVKYARSRSGVINVSNSQVWMGKDGVHYKPTSRKTFDATAIYCPDTRECYYVRNNEIGTMYISLRIEETKNGQRGNKFASEYRDPKRLFE